MEPIRYACPCCGGSDVLTTTLPWAASRNFVPDVVFKGSTLTGWHPLGQSDWRAQDGEIYRDSKE